MKSNKERERLRLVTVYWDDHCSVESRQRLRVRGGSPLLYMEPTGAVLPDGGIITIMRIYLKQVHQFSVYGTAAPDLTENQII
jgi:hypothetical protein